MRKISFFFTQDGGKFDITTDSTNFGDVISELEAQHEKTVAGKKVVEKVSKDEYGATSTLINNGEDLVFYVFPNESKAG
jgi:hypothetical protein